MCTRYGCLGVRKERRAPKSNKTCKKYTLQRLLPVGYPFGCIKKPKGSHRFGGCPIGRQHECQDDGSVLDLVKGAAVSIYTTRGLEGFFVGGAERALYYAPVACLFFTIYDTLLSVI